MDKGRAILLALLMWGGAVGSSFAHGLPGSVLILSRHAQALALEVQIPLEELIIAAPALQPLEDAPQDREVPAKQEDQLAAYFDKHLMLEQGAAQLPLSFGGASLKTVQHHDVGSYALLVLEFTATLSTPGDVFPMMLTYDAVMHEVRSHNATVYWSAGGDDVIGLARFRYKTVNGSPEKILLNEP